MKLYFSCILFLVLFSCQQVDVSKESLDPLNFSFEIIEKGKAFSWRYKPEKIRLDSLDAGEGKYSIQLDSAGFISSNPILANGVNGDSILISFNYKLDEINTNSKVFGIFFFDKYSYRHYIADSLSLIGTNGKWEKYEYITVANKNFGAFYFNMLSNKKELKIDNIHIELDGRDINKQVVNISEDELQFVKKQYVSINSGLDEIQQLQFLPKLISSKRLVSLGETTHGTSDVFLLKNTVIKFLIENEGFNTIIFEGNTGDLDRAYQFLNEDALHGVDSALSKLFEVYHVEEVKELLSWIQGYNTNKPSGQKIIFTGVDVQSDVEAYSSLMTFAQKNSAKMVALLLEYKEEKNEPPVLFDILSKINDIIIQLKISPINQNEYLGQTTQLEQFIKEDWGIAYRDFQMAENIKTILDSDEGVKAIFWAHNAHVQKSDNSLGRGMPVGFHLDTFGVQQYVIGFALNKGDYRARNDDRVYSSNELNKCPTNSYEYLFDKLNTPRFFIQTKQLSSIDDFSQKKLFRLLGANISPNQFKPLNLLDSFDGIIYLNNSTPAKSVNDD